MNIVDYIIIVILNALCIVAAIKDAKTRKIPNWIPISLFVIWFLSIFIKWGLAASHIIDMAVMDVFAQCAIQIIFACIIFCVLAICINIVNKGREKKALPKTEVFGMGDIKLLLMICLYLGIYASLICIFIACVSFIFFMLLFGKKNNRKINSAPFAPFILCGVMVSTIFFSFIINIVQTRKN